MRMNGVGWIVVAALALSGCGTSDDTSSDTGATDSGSSDTGGESAEPTLQMTTYVLTSQMVYEGETCTGPSEEEPVDGRLTLSFDTSGSFSGTWAGCSGGNDQVTSEEACTQAGGEWESQSVAGDWTVDSGVATLVVPESDPLICEITSNTQLTCEGEVREETVTGDGQLESVTIQCMDLLFEVEG